MGTQVLVCVKIVWHIEDAGMLLEHIWEALIDFIVSAGLQKLRRMLGKFVAGLGPIQGGEQFIED